MRGVLICLLLICCTSVHAKCPQTAEFKRWLQQVDSPDPLIQLPAAFSLPPVPESDLIDAECIDTLLPSKLPKTRKFLIVQLAEARVAEDAFLQRAALGLFDSDAEFAILFAAALARRGTAAVPVLLSQLLEVRPRGASAPDTKRSCRYEDFRPWRLAGFALYRIGPAALPQIAEFVRTPRTYPLEPGTASLSGWLSDGGCLSSLMYLFAAVKAIDPRALFDLYETSPIQHPEDAATLLEWMGEGELSDKRHFLNNHPNLIGRVVHLSKWTRSEVDGLSAAVVPALLPLLSEDSHSQRDWAFSALWRSESSAQIDAVQTLLLNRLADPSPELQALPIRLLLDHGLQVSASSHRIEQLRALTTQAPTLRQLAAWKALRELDAAAPSDLRVSLVSLVDDSSAWGANGAALFHAIDRLDLATEWAEISKGLSDSQKERLELIVQASSCKFGTPSSFADRLLQSRQRVIGEALALALATKLRNCAKTSVATPSYSLPDVLFYTGSSRNFWHALHAALGSREFAPLGLRVVEHEPAASSEQLLAETRDALVTLTAETIDHSLQLQVSNTPRFVSFLKRELFSKNYRDPIQAANLLRSYNLVADADAEAIATAIEQNSPSQVGPHIRTLMALGHSGWDALLRVRPNLHPELKRRVADEIDSGSGPNQGLMFLMAEATDPAVDAINYGAVLNLILSFNNAGALTEALASHPEYFSTFLERALRSRLADESMELLARTISAHPELRRSALQVLAKHPIHSSAWYPDYWRLAASLQGTSRRGLMPYLRHSCLGVRELALGTLLSTAQTVEEQHQLLDFMLTGTTLRASSRCSARIRDNVDLTYSSKGEVLPFISAPRLEEILKASNASAEELARQFLRYSDATPIEKRSSEARHRTRWAIERLGFRSSIAADQALIESVLRRYLGPDCASCLEHLESVVARGNYDSRLLIASGLASVLSDASQDFGVGIPPDEIDSNAGLSRIVGGISSAMIDSSVLMDTRSMASLVAATHGRRTTRFRNRQRGLPAFYMVTPSDRMQLPDHLSEGWLTFKDAWHSLRTALNAAGYTRYGLFGVDRGFAAVTALERMNADGSSTADGIRWQLDGKARVSSLSEYIAALFLGEFGHYRLIAFVLSPQLPAPGTDSAAMLANAETAQRLFIDGHTDLPNDLESQSFSGCHLYALVYEYERVPGKIQLNVPGAVSSLQHLQAAGILNAMNAQ